MSALGFAAVSGPLLGTRFGRGCDASVSESAEVSDSGSGEVPGRVWRGVSGVWSGAAADGVVLVVQPGVAGSQVVFMMRVLGGRTWVTSSSSPPLAPAAISIRAAAYGLERPRRTG